MEELKSSMQRLQGWPSAIPVAAEFERVTTQSTMSASRYLLFFLLLWVAVFPVKIVAGWLAPVWVSRHFGATYEFWMLGAFTAAAALMIWMVAHCITSSRLSRGLKNKWYGLLFVGGPIAAVAYLWSELGAGGSRR